MGEGGGLSTGWRLMTPSGSRGGGRRRRAMRFAALL